MEDLSAADGGSSFDYSPSQTLINPQVGQCIDGRSVIAVWEMSEQGDAFDARLTIKPAALPIVTELLTTLTLNRMAQALEW